MQHRFQESGAAVLSLSFFHVDMERAYAYGVGTVAVRLVVPHLLAGFEKDLALLGPGHGKVDVEGATCPVIGPIDYRVGSVVMEAFGLFKVGEDVAVAPAGVALGAPPVVVDAVPAGVDQGVEEGRTAHALASWVRATFSLHP